MNADLRSLLAGAAEDLVPEPFPLDDRLDGVRRLVRRRRAVRRVQAGAGAVLGVAAIGSASMLLRPVPQTLPAGPAEVCGESFGDVVPSVGDLDGFATIQASDGLSVTMRTQLENAGDLDATTVGDVQMLVSSFGTGRIAGYAEVAPSAQATVLAGASGDLVTTASLVSCGVGGVSAGEPLPDGSYDMTLTGVARTPDGSEFAWTAGTNGITVENGRISEYGTEPDTTEPDTGTSDPSADGTFEPVCGAMIPAVPENPMWARLAAPAASFMAADPDAPYEGGMTLDVTLGTISAEPLTGELSPEIVIVLTQRDGTVVTWWRASEHGRPLDLGPAIELAAEGTQDFEGFGWFPVVDSCTGGSDIADGEYRVFAWLSATVTSEGSDAVEHYPVLTVGLDVTVADGVLTQD